MIPFGAGFANTSCASCPELKSSMSREEEIPQEEEDNLNESSGEDKEMYSWDKLEYKANIVRFISNESTERQVQIASAVGNKLEEPVYDHRTRIKERSRPLQKRNDNQPISVFWEIVLEPVKTLVLMYNTSVFRP